MEKSTNRPCVQASVGIVKNGLGEILMTQRKACNSHAHLWGFPGGKLEVDEDSYQALYRELKEEIGIEVIKAQCIMHINHTYKGYDLVLYAWSVHEFQGMPKACEQQAMRWIWPNKIKDYPLIRASYPIIDHL